MHQPNLNMHIAQTGGKCVLLYCLQKNITCFICYLSIFSKTSININAFFKDSVGNINRRNV